MPGQIQALGDMLDRQYPAYRFDVAHQAIRHALELGKPADLLTTTPSIRAIDPTYRELQCQPTIQ
ncbi:hypothetical protein [Cerasicoccus maritimus]|uniref:hypothetical protein n=1 Tax=Cerasicoccus maritimus TaxID=490089 RepID=UPI00285266B0|nr:hypothetical protein [Cerasicoccus maritimus]